MSTELELEILTPQRFVEKCKLTTITLRPSDEVPKELIDSILEMGVLYPIIVDRDYYIVDGRRRYIICSKYADRIPSDIPVLRVTHLSYERDPLDLVEYVLANYVPLIGRDREIKGFRIEYIDLSPYQRGQLIDMLVSAGRSLRSIARKLGVSGRAVEEWYKYYLAYKAKEKVKEKVEEELEDIERVERRPHLRVIKMRKEKPEPLTIEEGSSLAKYIASEEELGRSVMVAEKLPKQYRKLFTDLIRGGVEAKDIEKTVGAEVVERLEERGIIKRGLVLGGNLESACKTIEAIMEAKAELRAEKKAFPEETIEVPLMLEESVVEGLKRLGLREDRINKDFYNIGNCMMAELWKRGVIKSISIYVRYVNALTKPDVVEDLIDYLLKLGV